MKNFFVNAKIKHEPDYKKVILEIDSIKEKNIVICYSNQFEDIAKKISKLTKKNVLLTMQVLGCSNPKFPKETEAIIIIGQGKFHSVSLAYESKLPTYILEGSNFYKIPKEEIEKMEKKEKGALLKYLTSKKVGVLISSKPGQERLKKAIEFKEKTKNKKIYLFLTNEINTSEFENFQIDSWVNTACPRMDLNEGSIINLDKIKD